MVNKNDFIKKTESLILDLKVLLGMIKKDGKLRFEYHMALTFGLAAIASSEAVASRYIAVCPHDEDMKKLYKEIESLALEAKEIVCKKDQQES